ncbi:unnamed protein product [Prorocentrum cordatum]|uniref:Uncharacterized protein n=1 Tax=Prorocentrum cordatum TaxID=2364126 RepID=A0ABN9UA95_9DINO|nr:unnamed protein product [Polarella glacialis]
MHLLDNKTCMPNITTHRAAHSALDSGTAQMRLVAARMHVVVTSISDSGETQIINAEGERASNNENLVVRSSTRKHTHIIHVRRLNGHVQFTLRASRKVSDRIKSLKKSSNLSFSFGRPLARW